MGRRGKNSQSQTGLGLKFNLKPGLITTLDQYAGLNNMAACMDAAAWRSSSQCFFVWAVLVLLLVLFSAERTTSTAARPSQDWSLQREECYS